MLNRYCFALSLIAVLGSRLASPAAAQTQDLPRWARVSFFGQGSSTTPVDGGAPYNFSEVSGTITAESVRHAAGGVEYALNVRFGGYPSSEGRSSRVSMYDAWAGASVAGGHLFVRGGQMWLTDLGGLGSVAGGLVEFRQLPRKNALRLRAGAFAGVEMKPLEFGIVSGITKFGGYFAADGNGAQKHVIGYVMVRNQGLTERSVVSITNFLPAGQQFFLYQAAEINVSGAGGQASSSLGYFFVNAHASPDPRLDFQGTYHRGQSIDFRTITDDILNGRPVPSKSLDGFLFESLGGRVTVEVMRGVRVFGGFSQDKTDSSTDAVSRVSFGASSANFLKTGLDVNVSDFRYSGGAGPSYDSWYVSVGRSLSSKVYVSGEYTTSLSVLRYVQSSGVVIESRPQTKRIGGTGIVRVSRTGSLLFVFEHTIDDNYTENRFLCGLSFRF